MTTFYEKSGRAFADDIKRVLVAVERHSQNGKRSVTIPNGDVATVISALRLAYETTTTTGPGYSEE